MKNCHENEKCKKQQKRAQLEGSQLGREKEEGKKTPLQNLPSQQKMEGKTQQALLKETVPSDFLSSQVLAGTFSCRLKEGAFLLMQNTSYQFIFSTMHRELGAQFLVTRMETEPVSFLPAHRRINHPEWRAANARHITPASVSRSRRATVKIYPKPKEIFLCYSNPSYLPFTRAMTSLNMQQLNTNQADSSAWCETTAKRCLNVTFPGNNVNISTITCLASSIISIKAQFNPSQAFCQYGTDLFKHNMGFSEASLPSVSA